VSLWDELATLLLIAAAGVIVLVAVGGRKLERMHQ